MVVQAFWEIMEWIWLVTEHLLGAGHFASCSVGRFVMPMSFNQRQDLLFIWSNFMFLLLNQVSLSEETFVQKAAGRESFCKRKGWSWVGQSLF